MKISKSIISKVNKMAHVAGLKFAEQEKKRLLAALELSTFAETGFAPIKMTEADWLKLKISDEDWLAMRISEADWLAMKFN